MELLRLFAPADALLLAAGLVLCVLVRLPFHALLPRRFERGLPAGDLSGVRSKIEDMSSRPWPAYEVPDGVQPGVFAYPMLFHWVVGRFPERCWRPLSIALNVIPDCVAASASYLALLWVLRGPGPLSVPDADARSAAALALLLVATMPVLLPVTSRMMSTNGRATGTLLAQLGFIATYVAVNGGAAIAAALAVVLLMLTVLTSMFGLQMIVFMSAVLAIVELSALPLAILAAGLGLMWFVPWLGGREILRFKYHHFTWYRRNVDRVFTEANARSLVKCFVLFARELVAGRRGAWSRLNRRSPLVMSVYSVPLLLLLAWPVGPAGWQAGMNDPVVRACLVTIVCGGLVFLATATRALTEWGQAERYWEAAAPALPVAVGGLTVEHYGLVPLVTVLCVQLAVLLLVHVYKPLEVGRHAREYPSEQHELEVFAYLESRRGEGGVILTLPQQLQRFWARYTRRLQGLPYRFIFTGVLPPEGDPNAGFAYVEEIFGENHQYPALSPRELQQRFGLTYVIALNQFLESREGRAAFVDRLGEEAQAVLRNDKYTVFRVVDAG